MPNEEIEVVEPEVIEEKVETVVPNDGLTNELLIEMNDNLTILSNHIQERNEKLDKQAEDLAKEEEVLKASQKELEIKEKAAASKKELQEKEIETNYREAIMMELNAISEMPQYESNALVIEKLDTINEQLTIPKDSENIINAYGFLIVPAIFVIWLLWKTWKNATDGLL